MDRRLHDVVRRDVVVARQRQPGRLHRDPATTTTHLQTPGNCTHMVLACSQSIIKITIVRTHSLGYKRVKYSCFGSYTMSSPKTAWMEMENRMKQNQVSTLEPVESKQQES
ncbi:unnamed protein product [Chrysodeixis includens]|uniref:Uncharacterized protein n=1 Tax=Chrysodeixis includens TaxID=689277 RepID=A0A9P0BZY7_CHRIL|nr:unnamed protein product [Chrysodeixis includens]